MHDILRAEIGKGLRVQLAHPAGHVITLLISTMMYLGLQFVLGQGELRQDLLPQTLVAIGGYWFLRTGGAASGGGWNARRRRRTAHAGPRSCSR